jgi:hypothetical protein
MHINTNEYITPQVTYNLQLKTYNNDTRFHFFFFLQDATDILSSTVLQDTSNIMFHYFAGRQWHKTRFDVLQKQMTIKMRQHYYFEQKTSDPKFTGKSIRYLCACYVFVCLIPKHTEILLKLCIREITFDLKPRYLSPVSPLFLTILHVLT